MKRDYTAGGRAGRLPQVQESPCLTGLAHLGFIALPFPPSDAGEVEDKPWGRTRAISTFPSLLRFLLPRHPGGNTSGRADRPQFPAWFETFRLQQGSRSSTGRGEGSRCYSQELCLRRKPLDWVSVSTCRSM